MISTIWEYVASDNATAARRLIDRFLAAFDRLAARPLIGHRRPDLTRRAVRFWPIGAYLIVYRAEAHPIEIVRVLHSARDIPPILDPPE